MKVSNLNRNFLNLPNDEKSEKKKFLSQISKFSTKFEKKYFNFSDFFLVEVKY